MTDTPSKCRWLHNGQHCNKRAYQFRHGFDGALCDEHVQLVWEKRGGGRKAAALTTRALVGDQTAS